MRAIPSGSPAKLAPAASWRRRLSAGAAAAIAAGGFFWVLNDGGALNAAQRPAPRLVQPDGAISFADLVEQVSPAVVSIYADMQFADFEFRRGERVMPRFFRFDGDLEFDLEELPHLRRFTPRAPEPRGLSRAQGSGFVIDPDGHIVTNYHVVGGREAFRVRFSNGEEAEAQLVGADPETDLAVLKVEAQDPFPFVEFAPGGATRVGDVVLAVGNPFGIGPTVTSGIVSAIGRNIGSGPYADYIQFDAAINRGNSGGPTFDMHGRVVGVNSAIYSPNGHNVGIGFAIPADVVSDVARQLIENGRVARGWLGVGIQEVTEDIREALGLEARQGALVTDVDAASPAAEAGLRPGDVILAVDGEPARSVRDLSQKIARLGPDKRVTLTVNRDGREQRLRATLDARETHNVGFARRARGGGERGSRAAGDFGEFGFRADELDRIDRRRADLADRDAGAVIADVAPDGAFERAGLRRGDVVLEVDRKPVETPEDIARHLEAAREAGKSAALMLVQNRDGRRYVAIDLTRS